MTNIANSVTMNASQKVKSYLLNFSLKPCSTSKVIAIVEDATHARYALHGKENDVIVPHPGRIAERSFV